ncbi:MAG: hypothetical protein HYS18_12925 [Burkholderiales bacterium]|nr:hypothetical protein [Burkholderiales bacterium]
MNQIPPTKKPADVVKAIFALDLEQVKSKMMHKRDGYGWTREEADRHEVEYKRFLALLVKYPDEPIAPSLAADKFWHGHILDTMKYAKDCQNIFGYFLHHNPYFGLRGEEDAVKQEAAADAMRRLYAQEFGSANSTATAFCGKAEDAFCGAAAEIQREAAFCGAAEKQAAFCGKAEVAFCGAAAEVQQDVAFCGAAEKQAAFCGKAEAAFCGAAAETQQEAAFCGAAEKQAAFCGKAEVAFCGAATNIEAKSAEKAAFCGAVSA